MKDRNTESWGGLRTLHIFVNFGGRGRPGMGAARPYEEPSRWPTWRDLRTLRIFGNAGGGSRV